MGVHNIETTAQFKEALANNQVVLVDFFATWCGPCKAIAPKVAEWSLQFPGIYYIKVDVDALPDIAQEYGIRAMPTFLVFKNGEKAGELVGAAPTQLLQLIQANNVVAAN